MLNEILKSLDKAVVSDIKVYDMKEKTPFYDYTVICSVNTSRQGAAAVDYLRDDAEKLGLWVRGYSSNPESAWFLVDLNEIVVHIFVGEERIRYNLDGMYSK